MLVNNAGGAPAADAATASPRFPEKIIALNLIAPLHFAQRANAVMQQQAEGGVIVSITSVSALRPSPGTAAYGAAKAGLISLTQSLAVEWAPKVRVVAVAAGMMRTEQSQLHYGDEAGMRRVGATVPLGRLAEPEDVGDACVFLASPLARYVSGATLAAARRRRAAGVPRRRRARRRTEDVTVADTKQREAEGPAAIRRTRARPRT